MTSLIPTIEPAAYARQALSTSTPEPFAVGDRVSIRRHSGVSLVGTVTAIGEWEPSCAGTPMRWIDFTTDDGGAHFVADTPHRDNAITRVTA